MIVRPEYHIACIGGGTGMFSLLTGLKEIAPDAKLSAIVTMMDSGGSTGRLRDEFGYLPPGDVRRCLLALSDAPHELRALMEYRFGGTGPLSGHNVGNLILTAFKDIAGGEYEAIEQLERTLRISGKVYPVTLDDCHLVATLADGKTIKGEGTIDVPTGDRAPITGLYLSPKARVFKKTRIALEDADVIIIGPGDLYTSVLPNLLVEGVPEAIATASRKGAKVLYVANTMTKHGETDGYAASDFLDAISSAIQGTRIDATLLNTGEPTREQIAAYASERAAPVEDDLGDRGSHREMLVVREDLVSRREFARHDPVRLAAAVLRAIGILEVDGRVRH